MCNTVTCHVLLPGGLAAEDYSFEGAREDWPFEPDDPADVERWYEETWYEWEEKHAESLMPPLRLRAVSTLIAPVPGADITVDRVDWPADFVMSEGYVDFIRAVVQVAYCTPAKLRFCEASEGDEYSSHWAFAFPDRAEAAGGWSPQVPDVGLAAAAGLRVCVNDASGGSAGSRDSVLCDIARDVMRFLEAEAPANLFSPPAPFCGLKTYKAEIEADATPSAGIGLPTEVDLYYRQGRSYQVGETALPHRARDAGKWLPYKMVEPYCKCILWEFDRRRDPRP